MPSLKLWQVREDFSLSIAKYFILVVGSETCIQNEINVTLQRLNKGQRNSKSVVFTVTCEHYTQLYGFQRLRVMYATKETRGILLSAHLARKLEKKIAMNAEFWECDAKMDILSDCLINLQKNYPQ